MEGTVVTSEEVRAASARLPERQREALELRDREQRSYEQIAAALVMSVGAVGQLIAHARINLYDELRGTSVAPSPDCERALPLIAMREDGQLEPSSGDAAWLDSHLAGCERCTMAVEQMGEAKAAYRAQEPAGPGTETDRPTGVASASSPARRRRRAILATALAGLLLLGGLAAILAGADRSAAPVEPASVKASEQGAGLGKSDAAPAHDKAKSDAGASHKAKRSSDSGESVGETGGRQATVTETGSAPVAAPAGSDGGNESGNRGSGGGPSSGKGAVEPTHQTAASKPSAKPKPAAPSSPAPSSTASAPAPAPESTTPAEEPADEPGHRGEPPGKPANRPPH
jgi:Sigma-70, region 4